MLVLSRKENESILIGHGITVSVVSVRGSRVRIGISAPPEVSIMRNELLERIDSAREVPSELSTSDLRTDSICCE